MSLELDRRVRETGTRFRLHAQSPIMEAFAEPETVWVSSRAGSLKPGPADDRMYVVDAIEKKRYEDGSNLPYRGRCNPPCAAGPDGHFDHLAPDDAGFRSAHIFGTVRRVLDIWEDYFDRPVPWHFTPLQERLEIVPWLDWNNAHFGWGFLEAGYGKDDAEGKQPFALNFDVLAHETGHGLVFSMVGIPGTHALTSEFRGFHESASDLVALISVLHFESFVGHLLKETDGNLYLENELNRIGELSKTRQIRVASNDLKMADVPDPKRAANDLTGKEIHQLGEPLTGAFFDTLVGIYQMNLVERGAISAELAAESSRLGDRKLGTGRLRDRFAEAYRKSPESFHLALAEARDILGVRLAKTWDALTPDGLRFAKVAKTFLTVDRQLSGWRHQEEILENFTWRQIGYGREIGYG